jgi:hypothetical protein
MMRVIRGAERMNRLRTAVFGAAAVLPLASPARAGWYLMVLPVADYTTCVELSAKLSEWSVVRSYDSAQNCEDARNGIAGGHANEAPGYLRCTATMLLQG